MTDVTGRDVDRGWAWVILPAAAMCLALEEAFMVSVGLFQVEFLETFSGSQGFVALICAVCICGQVIVGPVSGVLSDVLSHRVTIMAGGALRSVALLSASFSPDLSTLLTLFGVLAGLGAGLCYTPCVTVVCTYFHKYRMVANGITLAVPGVGILAAPYCLRWLIDSYGWRYAMAIHAGMMAQTCVLAALFFPHVPTTITTARSSRSPRPDAAAPQTPGRPEGTDLSDLPRSKTEQEVTLASRTNLAVKVGSWTEMQILFNSKTDPGADLERKTGVALKAGSRTSLQTEADRSRTDLEVEGGRSRAGLQLTPVSSTIIYEFGSGMLNQPPEPRMEQVDTYLSPSFRQRMVRLLCQKCIWIICANQVLVMCGFSINVVLYPAFARSVGAASHDIPDLYTAYGLSLSVARLTGGFVFSAIPGCLVHVLFGLQVALAVVFVFLPVYGVSLPALVVGMVMVVLLRSLCWAGVAYGPAYILLSPIILRYVPVSDLSMAFGLVMLCCGAAFITAPTIAGSTVGTGALFLLLLLFVRDLQPPEVKVDGEDQLLSTNEKNFDNLARGTANVTVREHSAEQSADCAEESLPTNGAVRAIAEPKTGEPVEMY